MEKQYKSLPETRTDLDYCWIEIEPEKAGRMIADLLEKTNGKAFYLDSYSTGDNVFRNLIFAFPTGSGGRNFHLMWDRENGHFYSMVEE